MSEGLLEAQLVLGKEALETAIEMDGDKWLRKCTIPFTLQENGTKFKMTIEKVDDNEKF